MTNNQTPSKRNNNLSPSKSNPSQKQHSRYSWSNVLANIGILKKRFMIKNGGCKKRKQIFVGEKYKKLSVIWNQEYMNSLVFMKYQKNSNLTNSLH